MLEFIVFIVLMTLGYSFGVYAENRHFRSIMAREKLLARVPASASKQIPSLQAPPATCLVSGSVVISVDYFKRFVAILVKLVGGPLRSYETLLERGRREAILRMKEQAARLGAKYVVNVKIETAGVSKSHSNSVGSIEVLAYGTALIPTQPADETGILQTM